MLCYDSSRKLTYGAVNFLNLRRMRRGSEKLLEILEEPHLSGVYLKESNQIHIVKSEEKFPGGSERREEKSFRIKPRAFFVKEKKCLLSKEKVFTLSYL